ncbi:zinc-dependent metalloprotease [Granulicoccus phenolivorans]|uniref:zinc-dependent metalloprotease n=1 Tax=Granulicoccus phenolivorans TaxID=266854 RepID=UPI0003F7B4DB|nr:zinc-dependent metalloprotease [Granulicoccus phenolivorans]
MADGVNWGRAKRTAARLTRPGPPIDAAGASAVVEDVLACALRAEPLVAEVTGFGPVEPTAIRVIDRTTWGAYTLDWLAELFADIGEDNVGVNAVEAGSLVAWLSTRVLGQYDPFTGGGQLLLLAPNIALIEQRLALNPADFRLWVTLHEATHRAQFGAHPWLVAYFRGLVQRLLGFSDQIEEIGLGQILRQLPRSERTLLDLLPSGEVRELMGEVTALMSLLEGHADVMMDRVGPTVIPSVATIRARFNARREATGPDAVIRRALGLDLKLAQYRDGARFCATVIDRVGLAGFNRVWGSPRTLPTTAEISAPEIWLSRMGDTDGT